MYVPVDLCTIYVSVNLYKIHKMRYLPHLNSIYLLFGNSSKPDVAVTLLRGRQNCFK